MRYREIEKLKGEKFLRLTGVKEVTIERMVENMILAFQGVKIHMLEDIKVLADSGYRGMQKIHANVELPHRRTKKKPLDKKKRKKIKSL
ncbi:hypothetical protein [Wolbachia endosymbiont (group E) of Neria commutata]|uniref:hypothetical protein n=1 Tax=Wolbachia endosymbiont (group E) of Neria commutata TaxID=3066149 RepID=UPI0031332D4D